MHILIVQRYVNIEGSNFKLWRDNEKMNSLFQNIAYPLDTTVIDFLRQNSEKCFILSTGSCNTSAQIGSYTALLYYKGRSKILKRGNIPTSSANVCILTGIQDAAASIKAPTDIIILTSTALGFNSPNSINYPLCCNVIRILMEKNCRISLAVCMGKGSELNAFIQSFCV